MNAYKEFSVVKKLQPEFNKNQSTQLMIDIHDIPNFMVLGVITDVRGYVLDCIAEDRIAEVIINICIDKLYEWNDIDAYSLKFEIFKRYLEDIYIKSNNLKVYINFRGIYQLFSEQGNIINKQNPITPLLLTKFETNFDVDNIFIYKKEDAFDFDYQLYQERNVLTIIKNSDNNEK